MSVPRDDWCIVGRRSPSAITNGSAFSTIGRKFSPSELLEARRALLPRLEERRRDLDPEDRHVRHDAERDLEERRARVPVAHVERDAVEEPRPADVEEDRDRRHRVAERAREERGPHGRVELALVQDVDEERDRVAAAAERRARHDVERDPEPPRVAVVQRRRAAEAGREAVEHRGDADRGDDDERARPFRQDGAAERNGAVEDGAHAAPPSLSWARLLRKTTAPSTA